MKLETWHLHKNDHFIS